MPRKRCCRAEPYCYADFRTGLDFKDVYHLIWGRSWKRRHGVLGKWRELKQAMYAEYLEQYQRQEL